MGKKAIWSYNARTLPTSSISTFHPSRLEGIRFSTTGVFSSTSTLIHGSRWHSPIAVPTTPSMDISRSVCSFKTCSIGFFCTVCSCGVQLNAINDPMTHNGKNIYMLITRTKTTTGKGRVSLPRLHGTVRPSITTNGRIKTLQNGTDRISKRRT